MSLINLKAAPKRSGWRRKLFRVAVVFVLLLVALYFVATSEMFLQRLILPRVSDAIKADVTVAQASVSPFRNVVLHDLKVHPRGSEPLLTVKEIRLRYSLLSIIRGKIDVEEVTVESPVITVVENPDGTSNLDALRKLGGSEKKPAKESSTPPQVNVKLVALNNATVRLTKNHAAGAADVAEVSGLNFSVRDLQNGKSGKLEVAANLALDKAAQAATAAGALRAKLGGGFTFDLAQDLKPATVKGDVTFSVEQATGAMADLATLAARLDCEATPTEVKQIALRFTKAEAALGEVRIAGPFDAAKGEGKLKLEVLALDRRVLNLAGAASGIDFGSTTINSTTDVELAKGGKEISLGGRLNVANFQITQAGQTSPTLDVRCDYAVTIDQAGELATVKFLNLSGTQNSQLFLQSELPSPLTLAWGVAKGNASDGIFMLTVTGWNLADWRAFAGAAAPTGVMNTKLKLATQQGGKKLRLELDGGVDKFSAKSGDDQMNPMEVRWLARADVVGLQQLKLEDYRLEILHQGQAAVTVTASGTFDGATQDADLQMMAQVTLARLLAIAPQPDVNVTSGTVQVKTHVVGKNDQRTVTGQLELAELTGGLGATRLNRFGVVLDFDAGLAGDVFELRKASGLIRESDQVGGRIEANGKFGLGGATPTGQLAVRLLNFNQDALRPFLAAALGEKKLVSIALNTTATVTLGADGDAAIKADAGVTNLVVSDPTNPALATPLQARIQVDAGVAKQLAQVRQCQLTLTPTDRAKNELNLTGKVDLTKPGAITGGLKLKAESLDVTRYYDLVAAKPPVAAPASAPAKTTKAAKPAPAAPPAPAQPEQEPAAVKLPLQNFTCDVDIGRFYLREMDVSNLQAAAKIDGGHVVLKPLQMRVNGAPVEADVDADLGVSGYRYAVRFDAQAVPLAPLVNTFQPDRKGDLGGQLNASAQLQGAGVTGSSLQTNLTGQFNVVATNLNLSINKVRTPIINAIVNTIIGLPDLIAGLSGKRDAAQMKWADEISARPIDVVSVNGGAGGGKIEVKDANVNSAAFRVQTGGEILLATVLTNSTLLFPVHVALARPYAAKIGMVNAKTPTNAAYVVLADFLSIKGTLGAIESDISKRGLVVLAGKTVGGVGKELGLATGESAKSLYNTVSGALVGKPSTNSPTDAATNNAAEPKKKSWNPFKREKKE